MRLVAPSNNRPPREKLTLANGIPVTIALQYSTGQRVQSRIQGAEDQMMYTLTDGRVAYLPLGVAQMIDELQLDSREPFTICKFGRDWEVQRGTPQQAPPAPPATRYAAPPAPPAAPPQLMNGSGEDLPAIFARCYAGAIDVTIAALESARQKGLQILPTHEGLQACAATLFIAETRSITSGRQS